MTNALYVGQVRHRRFLPKGHTFRYSLYMMWLNLDDPAIENIHPLLGTGRLHPLQFRQSDYLAHQSGGLKERACKELISMAGDVTVEEVYLLCQLRCFGVYFSPVNFFFFKGPQGHFDYMLAEVSNTPWGERHTYFINLLSKVNHPKSFNVSPFMEMQLDYHWQVHAPGRKAFIHIENKKQGETLFDATLALKRLSLTRQNVTRLLLRFPAMTLSIVRGIYWQALKIALKGVPFLGYQKT